MLPAHITPSLAAAANREIAQVLTTGAVAFGQKRPTGEVGFVAAVLLAGVPAIASSWKAILRPHGYSVVMNGILCHQTPYVDFIDASGTSRTCELADLLVVVDDLTAGAPGRRWAVLIQAKMAAAGGGKTLSGKGDLTQLELFSRWPAFTMPANFAPGARDFTTCAHAGAATDCGRYGLISGGANPVWNQQAPRHSMPAGGDELGTFLAKMLETGQTGYGRDATGGADDWSRTVDELTHITAGMAFNYAAGFGRPQPRGSVGVAFALADAGWPVGYSAFWNGNPPPSGGRPEQPDPQGPPEGISMMRIALVRTEG